MLHHSNLSLLSGDAYHITQPNVNGIGAILAMTRALKQVTA